MVSIFELVSPTALAVFAIDSLAQEEASNHPRGERKASIPTKAAA